QRSRRARRGGSHAAVPGGFPEASCRTPPGVPSRCPGPLAGFPSMMGSYGRVSRYGLIAFASSLDRIGPFATNVHDVATILQIIAGRDPRDSTSTTAPVPDYTSEIAKPIKGLRIGIPKDYFAEGIHSDVRAKVEVGVELFKKLASEIIDIRI